MTAGRGALTTIQATVERTREESIGFLRALIAAGRDGEEAVQRLFAARTAKLGCSVKTVEYDPCEVPLRDEFAGGDALATGPRRAVLARHRGVGGGRSLIFFAHPDSEPVRGVERWTMPPFEGRIVGGRLHGWGVADDLAGVAIMAEAMRVLRAGGLAPKGDVVLASTPSKRHARGVAALLHRGLHADAAVYLHPAESGAGMGEIKALTCGHLEFRLRVAGRPPPTSEPLQTGFAHLAINPVDKAFALAQALADFDRERGTRLSHPTLQRAVGRSTNLMVSFVRAGETGKLARMPEACEIGFALSFPPGERLADVRAAVEARIARAIAADDWLSGAPPDLIWDSGTSAAETPEHHPLYAAVRDAVAGATGVAPVFNPMHTGSDIRNPIVQQGIPTVGIGPLCGDLTQNGARDEWVDVNDTLRAIASAAGIVATWCGVA